MKKRMIAFFCAALLLLALPLAASAAAPKVVDDAGLLTDDEEAKLEQKAQALADRYGIDVVIVTVDDLGWKTSEEYADDYFDDHGYGIGPDYSGVLLLISMAERDWAISTCGDAIYALTDYGIESLFYSFAGDLSAGYYCDAFETFLDELPYYFDALANDAPVDGDSGDYDGPGTYVPGTSEDVVYYPNQEKRLSAGDVLLKILIALLIGAAVGGIVVLIMRSSMKTAKRQSGADNYLLQNSFNLRSRQDFFLYSQTSRVARSDNNNGGGGGGHRSSGGGGSSVHHSSSGRSHGGGHGKF